MGIVVTEKERIKQQSAELAKIGLVTPNRYPSKRIMELLKAYDHAVRESMETGGDYEASIVRCRYRDLVEALADLESGTPSSRSQ